MGVFIGTAYFNNSDNWEEKVLYIGKWILKAKNNVELTVIVKDGTVGIAAGAFSGVRDIVKIEIPASVRFIGEYGLGSCPNLTTVVFADPNGWQAKYPPEYVSKEEPIVFKDLNDWKKAALYLKETYQDRRWFKNG